MPLRTNINRQPRAGLGGFARSVRHVPAFRSGGDWTMVDGTWTPSLRSTLGDKRVLVSLTAILILGSVLRFYGLGDESLWNDELNAWRRSSYDDLAAVINRGVREDVHPPGPDVLLHFVQKHLGDSEWALRFPAAVAGTLSIFMLFLVGARLYSYREGLIASASLAVLSFPIYYSQEARPYSMLLLFTLLATYLWLFLLKALEDGANPPRSVSLGYVAAAVVCIYLHYLGLYLVALQGLGALAVSIWKRHGLRRTILIYGLILASYVPWLPTAYYQYTHNLNRMAWLHQPPGTFFVQFLLFAFNGSAALVAVALVLCLYPQALRLRNALKSQEEGTRGAAPLSSGLLLALWLFVPYAGLHIESLLFQPVLACKSLVFCLPAAYLVLARSITRWPLGPKGKAATASVTILLFLTHLLFASDYLHHPRKEQFREGMSYIMEHDSAYENSLIIGYTEDKQYWDYYFERARFHRSLDLAAGKAEDIPAVEALIGSKRPEYVWYIARDYNYPDPEFLTYLNERLTLIHHEGFLGLHVWLYANSSAVPPETRHVASLPRG
jgi:mannosyltransferase